MAHVWAPLKKLISLDLSPSKFGVMVRCSIANRWKDCCSVTTNVFHIIKKSSGRLLEPGPITTTDSIPKTILVKSILPSPNKSNLFLIQEILSSVMRNCKMYIMAKGGGGAIADSPAGLVKAIAQGWGVLE
jgi:hypothetical protein